MTVSYTHLDVYKRQVFTSEEQRRGFQKRKSLFGPYPNNSAIYEKAGERHKVSDSRFELVYHANVVVC